jgi:hypothetical protein
MTHYMDHYHYVYVCDRCGESTEMITRDDICIPCHRDIEEGRA